MLTLFNRLRTWIKRGTVVKLSDPGDSGDFQIYQVSYMGTDGECEAIWPYGIAGILPDGSTMTMKNVMGNEEDKAGVGSFPQKRFKNLEIVKKPSDIAIGNFESLARTAYLSNGDIQAVATNDYKLTVKKNGDIQIDGSATINATGNINITSPTITVNATVAVNITSPTVTINGNLVVNGNITSTGTISGIGCS